MERFMNKTLMYQYDKELASAFQIDCEDFLNEFEKFQSFNYVDFVKVWHQKSFSFVFSGQTYALLLRDFCDNCFYVVKKYIMFPRTLFTQIGAFYLLYGLYYKQPLRGWVKIRMTLEEYSKLHELISEMKNRHQLDAVYIFSKMTCEEVFLYVAERKPLGPEDRFVKGIEMYINDTFTSSKTQSSLTKYQEFSPTSELCATYKKTNQEYAELLKKYAKKCPTLKSFNSDLMGDIEKAYTEFHKEAQCSTEKSEEAESILSSRGAIKKRAMGNKNAIYRAARKVNSAIDENTSEDLSESDSD